MLIKPTRREFIKYAGAALGAAALFPKCAKAGMFIGNGGAVAASVPAQPAAAKLYGYNTLTFFDDFTSLSTIDVNNTLQPGYNWYVSGQRAGAGNPIQISPASCFSVNNSVLTFTPDTFASGHGSAIGTIGWVPGSPVTTVGSNPGFTGGAYFEVKMSFNADFTRDGGGAVPSFYLLDKQILLASANGGSLGAGKVELDFFECFSSTDINGHDYHWASLGTTYANTNNVLSNLSNYQVMNTYGCLYVPQAKTGGGGIVQRYFNGVLASANAVTDYSSTGVSSKAVNGSPTGWLSPLDTSTGFNLYVGSGHSQPINVDYVMVWQT